MEGNKIYNVKTMPLFKWLFTFFFCSIMGDFHGEGGVITIGLNAIVLFISYIPLRMLFRSVWDTKYKYWYYLGIYLVINELVGDLLNPECSIFTLMSFTRQHPYSPMKIYRIADTLSILLSVFFVYIANKPATQPEEGKEETERIN